MSLPRPHNGGTEVAEVGNRPRFTIERMRSNQDGCLAQQGITAFAQVHAEKPKHDKSEQCDDPSLPPPQAEPQAAPPATVDPLAPVEPLAVEETEQHAEQHADGKHDGNGKEHDKKK